MRPILVFLSILTILLCCTQKRNTKESYNTSDTLPNGHIYSLDSSTLDSLNKGMYKYFESGDTCLANLEYYSHYWTNDSLGKNGFRDLFGQFILKDCNCQGRNWNIVRKYLGRPNQIFILKDKQISYRYRLNYFSPDMEDIGTSLLDIDVDSSGIITSFKLWEVDG